MQRHPQKTGMTLFKVCIGYKDFGMYNETREGLHNLTPSRMVLGLNHHHFIQ